MPARKSPIPMPEKTDHQKTAALEQIKQLESEKAQIERRREKDAARGAIIDAQLLALRPLAAGK